MKNYTMRLFQVLVVSSLLLLLSLQVGRIFAQPVVFADSVVIAKSYPFFSRISDDKKLQKLIRKSKIFKRQLKAHTGRVNGSLTRCDKPVCFVNQLKWSDEEIRLMGNEFVRMYNRYLPVRKLVSELKAKGNYPLYISDADTTYLRKIWNDAAQSINRVFNVYINGDMPRYAKIDSISFNRMDGAYMEKARGLMVRISGRKHALFFEEGLSAALEVLKWNERKEAWQFEPLAGGLNQAPYTRVGETDFSKFRYSMILVPGLGPEIPGQALDPKGAKRCEEGAERYKNGLAPFIVVSGGNVHPFKTPFNEAVEMKKYMVEKLGIPAEVIFIEPHARHTTTNLRNTSRMIFRFGIPGDKPLLIVTDSSQASYIAGGMKNTAMRDLGYLPYGKLKVLSPVELEFYPVKQSLQPDPFDPLDP